MHVKVMFHATCIILGGNMVVFRAGRTRLNEGF